MSYGQENSAITDQTATRFDTGRTGGPVHDSDAEQAQLIRDLAGMNLRVLEATSLNVTLQNTDDGRLFVVGATERWGELKLEYAKAPSRPSA